MVLSMPVFGAQHSLVTGLHGLVATGLLTDLAGHLSGLFTQVAKAGTAEKISGSRRFAAGTDGYCRRSGGSA
jgi:hypothetical protein